MKTLVTGATGFTGAALVRRLLEDGRNVVALDCRGGSVAGELERRGAEIVVGSVTDRTVVDAAMRDVETVFHLAAAFREINVPARRYHEVNVEGTRIMLEAAIAAGARAFVYCSTCGVHGNVASPPAGEDAPIRPADEYQRTKYEGEVVARHFQGRGMKIVILRPAAIYGPGDGERFTMIFRRVARGNFPMFGGGDTLYHPLYIDNLVDAFVQAAAAGKDGEAYLIADENYVPIRDLVRRVARALGVDCRMPRYPLWPLIAAGHACEIACRPLRVKPPIFPRRVDWYRQNRAFRIEKARSAFGYRPRVGLDEGLRRTALWCRQEGLL